METLPLSIQEAPSLVEHMCRLDYKHRSHAHRLTTIIGSIGPSCRDEDTIYEMVKAGMNIARLNFAYDSHEEHTLSINLIRRAEERMAKELGFEYHVAIAGDLKGRNIRTGTFIGKKTFDVKRGDLIKFTTHPDMFNKCTKEFIYVDYDGFLKDVNNGMHVFLDDNAVSLIIKEVSFEFVVCQVVSGGTLRNKVSVVVPEALIGLPAVSEKDVYDIQFCISHSLDFLMLSKVYTADDVTQIRKAIGESGKQLKIITKLENGRALENFEGIATVSDALLFSRIDLSIELDVGRIFLAQKAIVARCNQIGKPIIIGPQVLMSMLNGLNPYRSDIADIGNALVDGADAVMLASVTAIGHNPVETVKILSKACEEAEIAVWHRQLFKELIEQNKSSVDGAHAVAISAVLTSVNVSANAIIVITVSGRSAALISKYRPKCPIIAVTRCNENARKMKIYRGIIAVKLNADKSDDYHKDIENRVNYALTIAYRMDVVKSNDAVVVVSPWKQTTGFTNNVRVIYAYFEKEPAECLTEKHKKLVIKAPTQKNIS